MRQLAYGDVKSICTISINEYTQQHQNLVTTAITMSKVETKEADDIGATHEEDEVM